MIPESALLALVADLYAQILGLRAEVAELRSTWTPPVDDAPGPPGPPGPTGPAV